MMKKHTSLWVALLMVSGLMAACSLIGGDDPEINVSESQLFGRWQKEQTQEYWRYLDDGTGVTWDESEDVSEEESNLTYRWTLNGDRLTHVFSGTQGNQAVPKVYTIKQISANSMTWQDDYKMEFHFNKAD